MGSFIRIRRKRASQGLGGGNPRAFSGSEARLSPEHSQQAKGESGKGDLEPEAPPDLDSGDLGAFGVLGTLAASFQGHPQLSPEQDSALPSCSALGGRRPFYLAVALHCASAGSCPWCQRALMTPKILETLMFPPALSLDYLPSMVGCR